MLVLSTNLWKSIKNAFQNGHINKNLFSTDFHKGVNKGVLICGINVHFPCDLSERSITRTRYYCQPLGITYGDTITKLDIYSIS